MEKTENKKIRRVIIDTDTASDDAAAIMLTALLPDVELLGVTVLAGNVSLEQAARNAKMALEVCGCDAPVYKGAEQPLFRKRGETMCIHGQDGMGDCGIIEPKGKIEDTDAITFILEQVAKYPGEVELITLGPATNIALAILRNRRLMSQVKHIWSMGTPGFGPGNASPVAEFNVFIDAEAWALMMKCGCPITVAGFDICLGDMCLDRYELSYLASKPGPGEFLTKATSKLLQFNIDTRNEHQVDLPDAMAAAAFAWPDFVKKQVPCYAYTCTEDGPLYGQVVFYRKGATYESMPDIPGYNVSVLQEVDVKLFTDRFTTLLTGK